MGDAFGRLDTLTTVGTGTIIEDATPVFTQTYPAAGGAQGRVLIDDNAATYFVTTNTATVTGTPTFSLDFQRRDHQDLGTIAAGANVTRDDQELTPTAGTKAYLLRTSPGNRVRIIAHPDAATLDTRIQTLNRDETVRSTFNGAIVGQSDLAEFMQPAEGWSAVVVSSPTPVAAAATFDLTAASFAPTTYARAATATAFDDACAGGTVQPMNPTPPDPAHDEGLSQNAVPTPGNFSYFGFAATQFTISTNGWLSFAAVTSPAFANQNMPATALPNAVVAPYWDDLENVVVCTKTIGSKLVVQWTGNQFLAPKPAVSFQAILDGADNTIEFVWGAGHAGTAASATVGIEDPIGNSTNKVGFNQAGMTPPGTSLKFTPN